MAAYEVLLLNTAIPQIQAAQSGDTYVVPRDIAFSTVANLANGTNLLPSLTFSSDTNTGIYREGADALGFTAGGGTNQMVLTSTGLGIGTSSPAYKLDVSTSGTTTIRSISTANGDIGRILVASKTSGAVDVVGVFASEGNASDVAIGVTSNHPLVFLTNNTERMRLDSSGNLGLGVTPSASTSNYRTLQIGGGASVRYGIFGQRVLGSAENFMGWNAYGGDNTNTYATGFYYTNSGDGATLYSQTGFHSWHVAPSGTAGNLISFTQAMTLDASGNLAVGDTSSSRRLKAKFDSNTVYSASSMETTSLLTYITNGSTTVGAYSGIHFNTGGDGDAAIAGVRTAAGDMALTFGTRSTGSGNIIERARITSGGDLLVGTTGLPVSNGRLSVSASSGETARLYQSGGDSLPSLALDKSSTTDTTSQVFAIFTINAQATGSGQINANGASQAAFGSFSDRRLKENIVDLESQWQNIKSLRPVEFDYVANEGGGHQIGFIAQEVQTAYPDLVGERSDGMLTLSGMGKNEARLIKALQEAMARIEKLEAEVAALKGA